MAQGEFKARQSELILVQFLYYCLICKMHTVLSIKMFINYGKNAQNCSHVIV